MRGRTLLQQMSDKSLPHAFTEEGISAALQKMKPATAPGYDNIHVEFLKNLGPKARAWLSKFFSRIMATHSVPKIWRKAKVIAVEKPGKDPSLASNYCPISLLSVLQAPGASCTPAYFSHSRRFTQSRPGWFSERSKHLWSGCCPHHFHQKWIPAVLSWSSKTQTDWLY